MKRRYFVFIILFSFLISLWFFYLTKHNKNNQITVISKLNTVEQTVSGNYLAGYYAYKNHDVIKADAYLIKALSLANNNQTLTEISYLVKLLKGDINQALVLLGSHDIDLAGIVKALSFIKNNDYMKAITVLKLHQNNNNYLDKAINPLLMSWCYLALNDFTSAIKIINAIDKNSTSYIMLEQFKLISLTTAMLYDLAKKNSPAEEIYNQLASSDLNYITSLLIGNFYERNNKPNLAKQIYQKFNEQNPYQQLFIPDLIKSDTNYKIPQPLINNCNEAIAFLLSQISDILSEMRIEAYSLIYANIANYVTITDFGKLVLVNQHMLNKDYDKAKDLLLSITADSFVYLQAQTNLAICDYRLGKKSQSYQILNNLKDYPYYLEAQIIYADLLKDDDKSTQAINIYTYIIDNYKGSKESSWYLYYIRSMNYYLIKDYVKAESDLLKALSLNPNQISVMNDLAYGWLIKDGKNLTKAFDMISKALATSPESPAILDSMGWALFLNNQYDEAQTFLEKASEIMPNDYTINDHLGDLYWQIGKKNIAVYEWNQSIENCQDNMEKDRIRKKLTSKAY